VYSVKHQWMKTKAAHFSRKRIKCKI